MEPSLLGAAVMEGGPDRRIKLDRNPGVDEVILHTICSRLFPINYKSDRVCALLFNLHFQCNIARVCRNLSNFSEFQH